MWALNLDEPKTLSRKRRWHPTPVLLPGKSHGRRSLVGCSPWGREELDATEQLPFHFSLSCIGEGNGNPLQCSCLENPRDGRAWWAAFYGIAQNRTRLKRLSSKTLFNLPPATCVAFGKLFDLSWLRFLIYGVKITNAKKILHAQDIGSVLSKCQLWVMHIRQKL